MRLGPPDIDTLTDRQREIHDAIASGPRGGVRGPLAVWLNRPELAARAQALGAYCRYDTLLDPILSELAILVTARVWSSEYEWAAHKPFALKAGLAPEIIEAIAARREPVFTDERQRAVYAVSSELNATRFVSQSTYDMARKALEEPALVDLVGILGYYTLISMTINAFEVPPPAGSTPEMSEGEKP